MTEIIFKIIIGSGLLLGLYHFLLAREKTFKFNRFFLIAALIIAYIVPFISLPYFHSPAQQLIIGTIESRIIPKQTSSTIEIFPTKEMLLTLYSVVSTILLLRLILSILKLSNLKGDVIKYQGLNLFLTEKEVSPFTFFNRIYVSKAKFYANQIDYQIIEHERCHIQEKHIFDLVLIEILIVFTWINPFLLGYKRCILANHEFLADQKVLKNTTNIARYQHLILDEIENNQQYKFIHSFNINNIKKRFIMMTISKSKFATLKNLLTLPAFVALFVGFSQKVDAQTMPTSPAKKSKSQVVKTSKSQKKNSATMPSSKTTTLVSEVTPPQPSTADRLTADAVKSAAIEENAPLPPPAQEIPAEYPGGLNAFRNKFGATFDTSKINPAKGLIKAMVHFTITKEGKTENYRAEGDHVLFNELAIEAAKKSTADITWKPAALNGEAVQSEFKLPISMYFE